MRLTVANHALSLVTLALGLIGAIGCVEPSDTTSVHGQVTYQGEPISSAALTFFPVTGRPVSATIVDGEYEVALAPGDYQVIVTVGVSLPDGWKEGDPLPAPKVRLAPQYTTRARTQLTASVGADQAEPIDFALE